MKGWLCMTGNTGCAQSLELSADMAAFTGYRCMRAGQREVTQVVVEACIVPIGWVMAGSAIRAELTVVCIVLLVA